MRLIFATNNFHKLSEIKDILGNKYSPYIFTMSDLKISVEPEETGNTFSENALIKSKALYEEMKKNNLLMKGDYLISDDTGLCIDYLDGAPGIKSARFMGNVSQDEKNNKILELLKDVEDEKRTAHFITVLSVIEIGDDASNLKVLSFEGKIKGYIPKNIEKKGGFGYDPIFAVGDVKDIKLGNVKTYSNLGSEKKNKISHRAIALSKFVEYLEKNHNI